MATKGFYGKLTEDQEKVLAEVKVGIPDLPERYDDLLLLRFLRARKFEFLKTVEMIKNDIEWRKQIGADTALETFPKNKYFKACTDYWPAVVAGKDKFGVPVLFERLGNVDPKSLCSQVPQEDLVAYHIYVMETAEARWRETAKTAGPEAADGGILYVEDFGGLGMRHFNSAGLNMVKMLSAIDQDHYPETLRKVIVCNAPSVFSALWKVISPWLDAMTKGKIEIFKSTGFLEAVQNEGVSIDDIPIYMGGKNTIQVPEGGVFGNMPDGATQVVVNAGGKHEHKLDVTKEGTVLGCNFKVSEHNIGFALYHELDGKRNEVIKYSKYEAEPAVEHSVTVTEVGQYVFHWDNSFSMFRKKTVTIEINSHHPEDSEITEVNAQ